jgi:cell division protein FtsB
VAGSGRSGFAVPGLTLQRVVTATALFVVVYSGFTIAGNAARTYELKNQTQQLQQQIATDQSEYQRIDALRRYMGTDAYIEASARQEGLVKPGDISIITTAPAATPDAGVSSTGAWWERYYNP